MLLDLPLGSVPLRTLSLWEPWASLIFAGYKLHETRHWQTKVRGTVAIHAAKSREGFDCDPELDALCKFAFEADEDDDPVWRSTRPLGCIIGIAELTEVRRTEDLVDQVYLSDQLSGNFGPGRYGFRLDNARALREPLPLKGRQGFFNWLPPADLEGRLGPVVDHPVAAARWALQYSKLALGGCS